MIQLQHSVDFASYGACELVFKGFGSTQTAIFSPNTKSENSLHYNQESLHHVYFFQFSLISVTHFTFTSVFEIFKIALGTDFPGVIIITSALFR